MRMRNLAKGQTLVFYVSFEVENDIRNRLNLEQSQTLTVDNIIRWSITQTWNDLSRQVPYWARQGLRHRKQGESLEKVFKLKAGDSANYEDVNTWFLRKVSDSL